jgi:hypothetical protein
MPVLLVDDRDGRIVAELEPGEVAQVFEALARDDGAIDPHYSLVGLRSDPGAIFGRDTSITIRSLT